jgi:hypothetical protein
MAPDDTDDPADTPTGQVTKESKSVWEIDSRQPARADINAFSF